MVIRDRQLGQGREHAKKFRGNSPEVMVEITDRVWREVRPPEEPESEPEAAVEEFTEAAVEEFTEAAVEEFTEADDLPISLDS